MKDDKVFFEKLLDLCREHKVNIEGAEVRIGDISFPRVYQFVNVTGQGEINKDNDAVEGALVIQPAAIQEISVKGRKGNEEEKTGYTSDEIFEKRWSDVEEIFEKPGWEFNYDKPGFNRKKK